MNYNEFIDSIKFKNPESFTNLELKALWYDKKGDWSEAHSIIQKLDGKFPALIHAFLHRKEGDIWNANYWYGRAGEKIPQVSLDEEWENLLKKLLND